MTRITATIVLALSLLTVGVGASMAAAEDVQTPERAAEAGIQGDEHVVDTLVPAGMGLDLRIDLTTFDIETSIVDPVSIQTSHDGVEDPNCLVLEAGEEGGLTPGGALHVQAGDEQPSEVPGCQDDDTVHTTGSDEMRFVTAGDSDAMFRLQRDFSEGWGWVWIECETGDTGVNFAIGPYDDLQHVECYINNYGNPATWTNYEAWVDNGHEAGLTYGSIHYVG